MLCTCGLGTRSRNWKAALQDIGYKIRVKVLDEPTSGVPNADAGSSWLHRSPGMSPWRICPLGQEKAATTILDRDGDMADHPALQRPEGAQDSSSAHRAHWKDWEQ